MKLDDLVGRIIKRSGLYLPRKNEKAGSWQIVLETAKGPVALVPSCSNDSYCYITSVSGAKHLTSFKLRKVVTSNVIETDTDDDDVVSTWSHELKTIKGSCIIKIRIDHTDFNGGSLKVVPLNEFPKNVKPFADFVA